MYDNDSKRVSPGGSFAILIGLTGLGLIVGAVAGILVWMAMTGKSVFVMEAEMMKPENANAIKIIQVFSTLITFFVPAWLTAIIASRRPFPWMGFNTHFNYKQFLLALLIMLASIPLVGALSTINEWIPIPSKWEKIFRSLEEKYEGQVETLSVIKGFADYIVAMIIMAILPAIFEETLFRGGMQNILTRWTRKPWLAILITSFLFSAIHFSYYGFLARFALGIILGLLYYYGGSIWLNIFAHAFNNALVVTQIYWYTLKGKPVKEAMNDSFPLWWGIIGIILVTALFVNYKRISEGVKKIFLKAEGEVTPEPNWMN